MSRGNGARAGRRTRTTLAALLLVVGLAATACAGDERADRESADPSADPSADSSAGAASPTPAGARGHGAVVRDLLGPVALTATDGHVRDAEGREVLLHGAAVNSLGDYYQGNPELPVVPALDDADWDLMADHGFSAVRLVVSWSLVEPTRGEYDDAYLRRVGAAVDAASERGILTVLDVHQDAWGATIASPEGTVCPAGTEPAIGWDGAPRWATLTNGASTCRPPGVREAAPVVDAAFDSFYSDRDGIQQAFAAMWSHLVTELGDRDGLVGYDLFNEPNSTLAADDMAAAYTAFVRRVIAAVRDAERRIGKAPAPIFLEPVVMFPLPGNLPDVTTIGDRNLVFSPHIYPGVLTRRQTLEVDRATASDWNAPLWIGEFSFGDTDPAGLAEISSFLDDLDAARAGWSWWLWQAACGDPHYVQVPRTPPGDRGPTVDRHHLVTTHCPGGDDEPNDEFLRLAARGYPRAAPGTVEELHSDPVEGTLTVSATGARVGQQLVAWLPPAAGSRPSTAASAGLADVVVRPVDGGAILTAATTAERYRLVVTPA